MNLLIVGYCSLADVFLYGSKALEKLGYNIYFFPYHNYVLDNIENRDDILIDYIYNNKIDICLWWNNQIIFESISNIVYNTKIKDFKNYFFKHSYNHFSRYNSITLYHRMHFLSNSCFSFIFVSN